MIVAKMSKFASQTGSAVLACLLLAPALFASTIIDPADDFLPTFTEGPQNGDLDVLEAEVFFDGSDFLFTSTSADDIGTTEKGVFVWGVNRGAGFATFPVIAPGVTFDAVVVIAPGGESVVMELDTKKTTAIPKANVSSSETFLSARVAAALLPSLGFEPKNYTVNLWPRSEPIFEDEYISDFAPDNSNAAVTFVPEPATIGLTGLLLAAALSRVRRSRADE